MKKYDNRASKILAETIEAETLQEDRERLNALMGKWGGQVLPDHQQNAAQKRHIFDVSAFLLAAAFLCLTAAILAPTGLFMRISVVLYWAVAFYGRLIAAFHDIS